MKRAVTLTCNVLTGEITAHPIPEAPSGIGNAMVHLPSGYNTAGASRTEINPVWFSVPRACGRCHGLGYIIIGEDYQDCPVCKGVGIQ